MRQARGADKDKLAGAGYVYISHTNKLLAVTPGGGGELDKRFPAVSYQHFKYDADGNMTNDNSKDMSIAYDWRGMPVEFKRFRCTTKGSTVCDSVKLVMAYAEAVGGLARISGGGGRTRPRSSVSGFEPSIITPQINGYFSEWWTPNWFDW
ncbi:MAG: hypothetical protein MJZ22_05445 [Candidatus Saccharibacteria bacterium]|nr:hypothetical protein [Candidatus Saccharibacteria bacterium]